MMDRHQFGHRFYETIQTEGPPPGVYTSVEGAQAILVVPKKEWVRVLPVLPVVPRLMPPSARQHRHRCRDSPQV